MLKKDDIITVKIEDLSSEGLGIGHTEEGMAIFVKDSVIGDLVSVKIMKMKKTYAFGRLVSILTPSADRIDPPCPVARSCGGCQIQMMNYQAQLAYKQRKVQSCIERIGGLEGITVEKTLGMTEPYRYRNKAQFPVGCAKDGKLIAGFYAGRTHSIIDNRDCLIGAVENKDVLNTVLTFMEEYKIAPYQEESGRGLIRHVMTRSAYSTGDMMIVLVVNGEKIPHEEELVRRLRTLPGVVSIVLNVNRERTNVILGRKMHTLWGSDTIEDQIGEVHYQISARSFYQVNPQQTRVLYEKALEFADLQGHETVWDLYCGIGTISLFLAQKAKKVYGVEIIEAAIADAQRNARLNGFTNTEFFVGKAEEVLPEKYKQGHQKADVIVIDPPRKGCERSVLDTMIAMEPQKIVYVSCDPATLARDLKILTEGGYRVDRVQPVDMFPHSVHVETVVLMTKVQK